jgi:hypothetical protein
MNARRGILLAALVAAVIPCGSAHAGVRVGIGIGFPCCWGGPYCYPAYVAPAPVVYYAPPVVAVPAATPVVAQPACASAAPPASGTAPAPQPLPTAAMNAATETSTLRTVSAQSGEVDAQRWLQALANPEESARVDAATALGRMKSPAAVDPLAATLAGDRSPAVRAAAARALAVIGDPRALLALQRAVQGDADNDVRRTAQFAMEVIASR